MATLLDEFLLAFKPTIKGHALSILNTQLRRISDNIMLINRAVDTGSLFKGTKFDTLNTQLRQTSQYFREIKQTVGSADFKNINKLTSRKGMGILATGTKGVGKTSMFSAKDMLRTFIGYDIYSIGREALGGLVSATQEMGAFRSRFYAITKDEAKANEQLQFAFNLADKLALNMKSVADSYSIFYSATAKSMGDKNAQQVFKDWSEVSRVLHLTDYQFERVTYALREMASKGAIYSQDLRMQIGTHVPNAMGIAEKAVNELGFAGTDWFDKFQKAGKGNQKLINEFIVLFSKYAKLTLADADAVAKALKQPDAQIVRLKQQWDKFRYAFADAGFTEDLMTVLYHVNNLLDKIVAHAPEIRQLIKWSLILFASFKGAKFLFKIGSIILNLVKHVKTIFQVFKMFTGLKAIHQLWTMLLFLNSGTKLAGAMNILLKFLPLLTNPYVLGGILIIALGAVFVWLLKTQFPNVWMTIMDYFTLFKVKVSNFLLELQTHPFFKLLAKIFGEDLEVKQTKATVDTALQKTEQKHREAGGFWGREGAFKEWLDIQKLKRQTVITGGMTPYYMPMTPNQKVNIEITHHIQSDGTVNTQEALNALANKETSNGIISAVKGRIKRMIGK